VNLKVGKFLFLAGILKGCCLINMGGCGFTSSVEAILTLFCAAILTLFCASIG